MAVKKKIYVMVARSLMFSLVLGGAWQPLLGAEVSELGQLANIVADTKADTNMRMGAAIKLGQTKNPEYLQVLTDALKDSNKAIRWTAAEALWELGDKRAAAALIEYLEKGEAYEWGKVITMNALASFKDPRSIGPLIKVLDHPNPFLRRSAAVALYHIGDDRAIPALIELLKDEVGFIQRVARNFLVEMTKGRMSDDPPWEYDEWARWYQANSHLLRLDGTR